MTVADRVAGPRAGRERRRLLLAALSQAASSSTNFALYAALLMWADGDRFGRMVAVLAVYQLALALSRALVSEPMVAADGTGPFTWVWCRHRLTAIGLGAAAGVVVVGWLVGADGATVAIVAAGLPVLLRQDGQRNLSWARDRPRLAVAIDGVWLAVTGSALAVLTVQTAQAAPSVVRVDGPGPGVGGFDRPVLVVGSWMAGGMVSGLVGWALVETDPDRPAEYPSSLDDRQLDDRRLDDRRHSQALLTGARNLLPIAVATLVSPAGAGLLKAAIMPFTPILSLVAGLRPVVLPAMQRAAARGPGGGFERLVQRLLGWYAALAVVAVSATAALGSVVIDRVGAPASIDGGSLRWGGAIAVMTILSTLLADAIGFGRRPVRPVPVRLGEIGLEWATALAVALVLGSRHVVAGWAVGMALGTMLWLVPGLTDPGPNRR